MQGQDPIADRQAAQLARAAVRPLAPWSRRLDGFATQARLLDPSRLLQRGYSLTLGPDGAAARRAADLAPGDRLTTILADGRVTSVVQPGEDAAPRAVGKRRRGGGSGSGSGGDPGQPPLF
ncbi:hypothetical protein KDM41_16545 [bacterium]|nr:hypothetical protein [bacterium]